ncbi:pyruvate, phosphate dikinase [Embleya hyalina]|uniref:Pyruvate, phosphate dikinase n=1 Tax=Embleya hyalina TaxID=516124 RepID=A0A401Z4L0_9ACTN|nr:pyruvate, phosphate dikinase [Embleya hyalina]
MRCVGEIDITRPPWRERPTTLVPVILDHVANFEPGAAERRFEQGRQRAPAKEEGVLARLRALPEEADRLVRAGVLHDREDVFHLTFGEFRDAVREQRVDDDLIRRRKEEFRSYHALTPPTVLTSDGEAATGTYRRDDVPAGALIGLPVSAGTVEGRARVIVDMARADAEAGDILVTVHTDPGWAPLFVGIASLVTQVGGLMAHGAVIAREGGQSIC